MAEESKQKIVAENYLDALSKSQGSNRDTEGLGAMAIAGGGLIIGSVDAINGQDGEEVEFPVTRHELHALAEHWWTERIDHDFYWCVFQQTGSSEWRWSVYIARRLHRLGEILGGKVMGKAFDDAAARWRKLYKISDEDWKVFRQGTADEQETWREKFAAEGEAVTQPEGKALAEAFGAEDAAKHERQVGIAPDFEHVREEKEEADQRTETRNVRGGVRAARAVHQAEEPARHAGPMGSKEAQEKAARIHKAIVKKEKRLPILVQESQLYDRDSTARMGIAHGTVFMWLAEMGIPARKRGPKPKA